ncbi:MAG: rod shape-determining protein MreC [bacterium]
MDFENIKKVALNCVIGVAISLFFLLINGLGAFGFLYDWGNYISEPINYGIGQFTDGVRNTISTILEISTLREKNSTLITENEMLLSQLEEDSELKLQNEILLAQLQSEPTKNMTLLLARILGIDLKGVSEHVVIDLGSDDGIEVGDAVVIGDILVGEVRDVYKSTSRVRLVTNRNSNIVVLDRNTRAKGLVRGSLEGLVMEEILENENVNTGDVIIVWSDSYPTNLIIGTVDSVEEDQTSSTKKAILSPGVSLENLNYVFVVKDE